MFYVIMNSGNFNVSRSKLCGVNPSPKLSASCLTGDFSDFKFHMTHVDRCKPLADITNQQHTQLPGIISIFNWLCIS